MRIWFVIAAFTFIFTQANIACAEPAETEATKSDQASPGSATVKMPREGRPISIAGDLAIIKVGSAETEGRYTLFEYIVLPGGGPPPHVHSREDEAFYVLSGEFLFHLEGQNIHAELGSFIYSPKGALHTFVNIGSVPGRMLILTTPAGLEKFFEEAGHPVTDLSAPPSPLTPEDLEKIKSIAPKYGIEIKIPEAPAVEKQKK